MMPNLSLHFKAKDSPGQRMCLAFLTPGTAGLGIEPLLGWGISCTLKSGGGERGLGLPWWSRGKDSRLRRQEARFNLWSGNLIPHANTESWHGTTKQCLVMQVSPGAAKQKQKMKKQRESSHGAAPTIPLRAPPGILKDHSAPARGTIWVKTAMCVCWVAQSCLTLGKTFQTVRGDSPGKNTGVGCHALLGRIFPIQGLNPGLPHCRLVLYQLSYQGSPKMTISDSYKRRPVCGHSSKYFKYFNSS